jgi:eukaryotic translation initiation factor 2C
VSDLIGPPSNSPESGFEGMSTVQQYFSEKSVTDPVKYKVLQYPTLPTVDVGSRTKPILIPLELCVVIPGQLRSKSITGEISAKIIEHAAMLPQERYRNITTGSTFFDALAGDQDAAHFGLNCLTPASVPMRVLGRVLPPPKLMYGKNRVIEPALKGTWNLAGGVTFARPAPTVG